MGALGVAGWVLGFLANDTEKFSVALKMLDGAQKTNWQKA